MRIQNNMMAINALNQRKRLEKGIAKQTGKLASGLRVKTAADDAAGLSISEKMKGQIRGLKMASRNAQDASSYMQSREGVLHEIHEMTHRMRELAVQSLSDTLTDQDRQTIQAEFRALQDATSDILNKSEFNTKPLFEAHEASFYKFGGNKDLVGPVKLIDGLNNDLTISVDGNIVEITIAEGVYPPEELIDLIDTELMEVNPNLVINMDAGNKISLQVESGLNIDYVQGGLSFIFHEYVVGTPPGMIIGVTEFLTPESKLNIQRGHNDTLIFYVGAGTQHSIDFDPGSYTMNDLIDIINNKLEAQGQPGVRAIKYSNRHIALTSDKFVITGLSGNMIKLDGITSVLYDNARYGSSSRSQAHQNGRKSFTGGEEIEIARGENNILRFQLNGSADFLELDLLLDAESSGSFTLDQVVERINLAAEKQDMSITASKSGNVLRVTSHYYGAKSEIAFDQTNQAYLDLFSVPYPPTIVTGAYAELYGTNSLDEKTIIRHGKNDTLTLDVEGQKFSITLEAKVYDGTALVEELNAKLEDMNLDLTARAIGSSLYIEAETDSIRQIKIDPDSNAYRTLLRSKVGIYPAVYNAGYTVYPPEGQVGGAISHHAAVYKGRADLSEETFIETGVNDTLTFKVDGGELKTITIDSGDYTAEKLREHIQSKLDGTGITASLEGNNLVFTTVSKGEGSSITNVGGNAHSSIFVGKYFSSASASSLTESYLYRSGNTNESFVIDSSNNQLSFIYDEDGSSQNIALTIEAGTYNFSELQEAVKTALKGKEIDPEKISVSGGSSFIRISTVGKGADYQLRSFSGTFYDKVLHDEARRSHSLGYKGSTYETEAYIVGRQDLIDAIIIHPQVNDVLIFDFEHPNGKETFTLQLDAAEYKPAALIGEIQSKLNEQLVAKGFDADFLTVQIGGVETGTAESDKNKLVIKLDLPEDGENHNGNYIIDGVRGSAAYAVFYRSEGDPQPTHTVGVLDLSEGAEIISGVNDTLTMDINGEAQSITLAAGNYTAEELLDQINEQINTQPMGILASYFDNKLKLSFVEPGANTIDKIRGNAKGTLFFEISERQAQDPEHFNVGANSGQAIIAEHSRLSTEIMRINTITIHKRASAEKALGRLDTAIQTISSERGRLGALQNRLDSVIRNNDNYAENLQAAESRIKDADVAQEMMEQVRYQIIMESSTAMLAQANMAPQSVLQLLG